MRYLANALTVLRVVLTAVLSGILLAAPFSDLTTRVICAVVFLVAALTDFADGKIARSTGTVSTFGKFLDPVADKFLITATLICLSVSALVPAEMHVLLALTAVIVVFRDLAVTSLRMLAASGGAVLAAEWPGKVKTFVQCVAVLWIIVTPGLFAAAGIIGRVLLWLCILCTLYSGVCFVPGYLKAAREIAVKEKDHD